MEFSTLTQINQRLNDECDLFGEKFIDQDVELLGYTNSAIKAAESIILGLYEDYFLDKAAITLVSGTETYSAPSDIYANKIRELVYLNTQTRAVFRIKRIMRPLEYERYKLIIQSTDPAQYKYLITNDATSGIKLNIAPVTTESGALVTCYYIRTAKKLASASDSCDIPEFIDFIYAHVKRAIARKERLGIDIETSEKELAYYQDLMQTTLKDMVPDEDSSLVVNDLSFYEDFDTNFLRG